MQSYVNNSSTKPRVGDIVKLNEYRHGISRGAECVVQEIFEYLKSYGIKVVDNSGRTAKLSATNFSLVRQNPESEDSKLTEEKPWMSIVNGQIRASHANDEEAKEFARKLLSENHKLQVVVAQVMFVAKTKAPPVEFV